MSEELLSYLRYKLRCFYFPIAVFFWLLDIYVGLQSAMGTTLKCDGHAKVRWSYLPKCDGFPYKKETLKCGGLTRQSAMAYPIRKKR